MAIRAGIVVTGTEVLTGRVSDRNGPWLAEELRRLGVDIAEIVIAGDRPADIRAAIEFLAATGAALVITSGGLGPTADDLTAQVVAEMQGRAMRLDADLEQHIGAIVDRLSSSRGWRLDPDATETGVRKQALVPEGAAVLPPVGTAPGLVVPPAPGRAGPPVVVLPGPPAELRGMWPGVLADPTVQAAIAGRDEIRQRTMRLWGVPESELAATLRRHDAALDGLEITTCLRDGELEIVTRYPPDAQRAYDALTAAVTEAHGDALFSPDGRTVDEIVADALRARDMTIATAESCTAGLLVARLTELAGSSEYVLGGVATYANSAKVALVDVPAALIESVGAVSAEVAEAMAAGARKRFGSDVGVGITGIAGPGGGTPDKPVGLVHLCVSDGVRTLPRRVVLPGSRADVRARAVAVAMQMIRAVVDAPS